MSLSWRLSALLLTGMTLVASGAVSAAEAPECPGALPVAEGVNHVQFHNFGFTIAIPRECLAGGCGLIVDSHGATMTADEENQETDLRMLGTMARDRGSPIPFIVLQPQANGNPTSWEPQDDEEVFTFTRCLSASLKVSPKRRYMGGFSQGAFMTARLLCRHGDFFAAFAMIAGGAEVLSDCFDGPLPPMLYIHGRRDRLVPFEEASILQASIDRRMGGPNGGKPLANGAVLYQAEGTEIETLFHDSIGRLAFGHCVPGGKGRLGCSDSFDAGQTILDFYVGHPKP